MADFRFSKAGLPTRTVDTLEDADLLKLSKGTLTTDETIKAKDLLQTQSYNPTTRELTLANGNTVVLTGLDVPDYTLTGLYASKYSDNAIQISTGQVKTSTGQVIKLDSTLIKNTANWASGGGLDTGTIEAGALYYIFVIHNPTTLESNAVFSLSSTSPTLPSGYTEKFLNGTFRMFSHVDAIEFVQNWIRFYSFGVNDIPLNYNYVSNYDYTHVKTSTPNTLSIGNLSARDYFITTNIVMTSMSKKIQAPFSEGLDGNLLDATLIADTDYILYAICKENGAYSDIILIEKPAVITSPTLPSGFTHFAIIGYGRTNASSELLIASIHDDLDGWFDYNDLVTQTTPISFTTPGTPVQITNDGLGANTNKAHKPKLIDEIFNTTTGQFDFSCLDIGDTVYIRLSLIPTTSAANQTFDINLQMAVGGVTPFTIHFSSGLIKAAGPFDVNRYTSVYIGSADVRDYPAQFLFDSDANATIKVDGFFVEVKRRYKNK